MKIAISSDQIGNDLRDEVIDHLQNSGHEVVSFGSASIDDIFPFYLAVDAVCDLVLKKEADFGILICGSGLGMSFGANRNKGIRAALCESSYSVKLARQINDANVLCIGAWFTGARLAMDMVDQFVNTKWREGLSEELSELFRVNLNKWNHEHDGLPLEE